MKDTPRDKPLRKKKYKPLSSIDGSTESANIFENYIGTIDGQIVLNQGNQHIKLNRFQQRALKDYFNLDRIDL